MRQKEESVIFPPSICALGAFTPTKCETLYEKWCHGCNLVFCLVHHDPRKHNCRGIAEQEAREQAKREALQKAEPSKKAKRPRS